MNRLGCSQGDPGIDDRELGAKFEVLRAVSEGATVPGLERGRGGRITAAREPREVEPIARAELDLDGARDLDLGDQAA